eukprot:CAMPEP_0172719238 /NCGR_PEP_ID=MMETSP1074-20121228/75391_1 /TAXON_ID=2916 /ORGANISM="Ceratium fusus, Strain PA161109" /LENGTH=332 /DNA_ID=CAMNT_0013544571 /DNA_START=135 /DNA_END=1130 /DNA_ORIENTATION=-
MGNACVCLQGNQGNTVENEGYRGTPEKRVKHTFSNGATYTGEWLGNLRHGTGVQEWPDGARYEGEWALDKTKGKGKFQHVGGDVYEGHWLEDMAHGEGVYRHADGSTYEGQWFEDKQHGSGFEVWPDGARYEGQYSNGRKSGRGHFDWADGSSYHGEFVDNDMHGKGEYRWGDGRQFDGDWVTNRMHGRGIFTWTDGRAYDGDYVNDMKEATALSVGPMAGSMKASGAMVSNTAMGPTPPPRENDAKAFGRMESVSAGHRITTLDVPAAMRSCAKLLVTKQGSSRRSTGLLASLRVQYQLGQLTALVNLCDYGPLLVAAAAACCCLLLPALA